jgi:dTDP-4-amino-4,6-dideoxygalactose transaminase
MIYYPLCLHLQEVYRGLGYKKGDFPRAEIAQEKILSLPMYAELGSERIEEIAEALLS